MNFLAIDFETANYSRNSACAIGLVRVENLSVVKRAVYLIKPPENHFVFTYLHGISWEEVKNEPAFPAIWSKIQPLFRDIDFAVAHNASFDREVLRSCCAHYEIEPPGVDFRCTMQIARRVWKIRPTKLSDVCRHLRIPLKHHEALSDTLACARIMIEALRMGGVE